MAAASSSPAVPLYAATWLPPTIAAGQSRSAGRIRADGKCEKCVCEICICGTHHCPPTPRHLHRQQEEKQQLTTETRSAFQARSIDGRQSSCRPADALHGQMAWGEQQPQPVSSYTGDYRAHAYSAATAAAALQSPPLFDTSAPLQSSTTASASFPRHALPPPMPKRAQSPFRSAGEFVASSSYSSAYLPHACCPPAPFRPADGRKKDEEERDWQTEQRRYAGQQGEKRASMRPSLSSVTGVLGDSEAEAEKQSESRRQYRLHTGVSVQVHIPADAKHTDDDGVQRDMLSEKQREYGRKQAELAQRAFPHPALSVGGSPFTGDSTAHAAYAAPPLSSYSSDAAGAATVPPSHQLTMEDVRYWQTEQRSQYEPKRAASAAVAVRAQGGIGRDGHETGEERQWQSQAQSIYSDKGLCARAACLPPAVRGLKEEQDEPQPPSVTTMRAAYTGAAGPARAAAQRPRAALVSSAAEEDRSWVTESQYHYQKKEVESCPAAELQDRHWKERHGHLYYEKAPLERAWTRIHGRHRQQGSKLW